MEMKGSKVLILKKTGVDKLSKLILNVYIKKENLASANLRIIWTTEMWKKA